MRRWWWLLRCRFECWLDGSTMREIEKGIWLVEPREASEVER